MSERAQLFFSCVLVSFHHDLTDYFIVLECDAAGEERVPGPCPFSKDTSWIAVYLFDCEIFTAVGRWLLRGQDTRVGQGELRLALSYSYFTHSPCTQPF